MSVPFAMFHLAPRMLFLYEDFRCWRTWLSALTAMTPRRGVWSLGRFKMLTTQIEVGDMSLDAVSQIIRGAGQFAEDSGQWYQSLAPSVIAYLIVFK